MRKFKIICIEKQAYDKRNKTKIYNMIIKSLSNCAAETREDASEQSGQLE